MDQAREKAGEYYEVGRERASELYTTAANKAGEFYSTAADKATEIANTARDAALKRGESIQAAIEAGKRAYAEEKRRTESSGMLEQAPTYYEEIKDASQS